MQAVRRGKPAPARAAARQPSARATRALHKIGLLPARQSRSLATGEALLATGRELLNSRDFDALTIAELAAANGLSVGSFYGRFRDKEAYFAVLQEVVVAEMLTVAARELAPALWRGQTVYSLVASLMEMVVRGFGNNRGIIKAALKHTSTQPETWTPFKRCAASVTDQMVALLVPLLPGANARAETRVRFVMQATYGLLVNAVLNEPGPYRLDDKGLASELAALALGYLATPVPAKGLRD